MEEELVLLEKPEELVLLEDGLKTLEKPEELVRAGELGDDAGTMQWYPVLV